MRSVAEVLREAGIENAAREARWLLEAAPDESSALELARRRADGEPLQYLTGIAGFRRLELKVGPGVLVPRPESEIVTQRAIDRLPRGGILVDIGTGSGAMALAVADERSDATVYATEISQDAMRWARINRDALAPQVELLVGDLFDALPIELKGRIDVLASNPPYIGEREREGLPKDVVDHEPGVAVFGGEDGLDIIRRLLTEASDWIKPGGWIVLEISSWQRQDVTDLLRRARFKEVTVEADLTGRDRVALGQVPDG